MNGLRLPAIALVLAIGAALVFTIQTSRAGSVHPPSDLRVIAQPGVPTTTVDLVTNELVRVRPLIDADFNVHDRPLLTVRLYATHSAFARALHRLEGVWPQGAEDTSGNVVHGILPLGPVNAVLPHNLSHVYTEWVMDRLTGDTSDRQPDPAWLYDGIAEWEADRRSVPVPCSLSGAFPLTLSSLASPAHWWATRAGIFGGLEYCEARDGAARLIARVGWQHLVRLLQTMHNWNRFSRALLN